VAQMRAKARDVPGQYYGASKPSAMFTTAFTNGWQSGQHGERAGWAGRRTDPAETSVSRDYTLLDLPFAAGGVLGLWLRDLHLSVSA